MGGLTGLRSLLNHKAISGGGGGERCDRAAKTIKSTTRPSQR